MVLAVLSEHGPNGSSSRAGHSSGRLDDLSNFWAGSLVLNGGDLLGVAATGRGQRASSPASPELLVAFGKRCRPRSRRLVASPGDWSSCARNLALACPARAYCRRLDPARVDRRPVPRIAIDVVELASGTRLRSRRRCGRRERTAPGLVLDAAIELREMHPLLLIFFFHDDEALPEGGDRRRRRGAPQIRPSARANRCIILVTDFGRSAEQTVVEHLW